MTLTDFADETASESPAPGGGSISAYMGALGAALGSMVANLSSHQRGWDDRWEEFSDWAEKGKVYQTELIKLVDEDTNAFNKIMDAFSLPKKSEEEKAARQKAVQDATRYATEVPFKTMKQCYECMSVAKAMAEIGNPNLKINAAGLEDKEFAAQIIREGEAIVEKANELEAEILKIVNSKI